ncbi:MAG: PIN/TRAM domain-containing protein [Actinobacteria bacterium]|nr:PIN/TRAM domain-containing protein [Actinomycetota bacterium]
MLIEVIRVIFIVMGAASGYKIVDLLRSDYLKTQSLWFTGVILSIFIGCGIGYVLGGVIGRSLARILNRFEGYVQKIPGSDLIAGVAGLTIGLLIATLVSLPLRAIPIIGDYIAAVVLVVFGYLGMRLSFRKKDDFSRMFRPSGSVASKEKELSIKGSHFSAKDKIVDTSTIIDGRIVDIVKTGFLEGKLIVPRFVLKELQGIADSEDSLKRNRGRRGLDVLNALQKEPEVEVCIIEQDFPEFSDVDTKLVRLAKEREGVVFTNDYNLNKLAELQGVNVLNINDLSNALKPVVLPGEEIDISVIKNGKEAGQGVGYLDDGTMVVIEGGKKHIGENVEVVVTSVLQTPAGRMIFTKIKSLEVSGV